MNLFDDIKRSDTGPAGYEEPSFSYVNRTARERYNDARKILDQWFEEYSRRHPDEAENLRNRFRSTNDEVHYSALIELYIHNLLVSQGLDTEVHPELRGSTHHPDFLAKKDNQPKFYVEVTAVYGDPASRRVDRFESAILDTINEIGSPDFFVSIEFEKSDPNTPPPLSKIKKCIQAKLLKLSYDKLCKYIEETSDFPILWKWSYKGWVVGFRVSPVSEEGRARRNQKSRIVGAIHHPVRRINLDDAMKKGLVAKAKRYGKLDLPFIVAANIVGDHIFCDEYEINVCFVRKRSTGSNILLRRNVHHKTWTKYGRCICKPQTGIDIHEVKWCPDSSGLEPLHY